MLLYIALFSLRTEIACHLQVAWQNGLTDLAMPFMIQFMKDYVGKVDVLMADRKDNMEARKVAQAL